MPVTTSCGDGVFAEAGKHQDVTRPDPCGRHDYRRPRTGKPEKGYEINIIGQRSMKRQRGRNNGRKPYNQQPHNPNLPIRSQSFDSNGPDVRVRGNAFQILEKYVALARDAQSSGDRVAAENYFQHAEHYYRLINESGGYQQRPNPNQNFQGHGQGQPPGDQDQRYQQGQAPADAQMPGGSQQAPQVVMRQGGGMHQPVNPHGGGATVVPSGYAAVGSGGSDDQPD